jgi:hypothetical protein
MWRSISVKNSNRPSWLISCRIDTGMAGVCFFRVSSARGRTRTQELVRLLSDLADLVFSQFTLRIFQIASISVFLLYSPVYFFATSAEKKIRLSRYLLWSSRSISVWIKHHVLRYDSSFFKYPYNTQTPTKFHDCKSSSISIQYYDVNI